MSAGSGHRAASRRGARDAQVRAVVVGNLNLVRPLGIAGVRLAVASTHADDRTFYSRYCSERVVLDSPSTSPEGFVRGLEAYGSRCGGRPLLVYGDDHALVTISRHRERLARYYRFRMPDPSVVEALVDKVRFGRLARELGLPVPRTLLSEEAGGAAGVLASVGVPCILKPALRRGWFASTVVAELGGKPAKVVVVPDAATLERDYPRMAAYDPAFVVQEFVEGGDDRIYSYHAYLDERAAPLAEFVGRKVRTFPRRSGVSTYLRLVDDEEVRTLGREIAQALRLRGIVKMDFKRDARSGRTLLLEINARYNLWVYLGAVAGVNLSHVAYLDAHGLPTPQGVRYRTDLYWLALKEDVKAFLDARKDGVLSLSGWLRSYGTRKVYNVFAWRDPYPWVVSSAQYAAARWRRLAGSAR